MFTNEIKLKVEQYLKENECATSIQWNGDDTCTTFDKNNVAIDDYIIEVEDGKIYYTPVSNWNVTLEIE